VYLCCRSVFAAPSFLCRTVILFAAPSFLFATEHWAPGLLYVAASRGVYRDCLAFDQVEINELDEITHMPFYDFNRFEKLNTSASAELMFVYFERLKLKQPSFNF
jgi:hypothetical protein